MIRCHTRRCHTAIACSVGPAVVPFQVLPLRLPDHVKRTDAILAMTPMTDLHFCRPTVRMHLLTRRRTTEEIVGRDFMSLRPSFATVPKVLVREDATVGRDEKTHLLHLFEPSDVLLFVSHAGWFFEPKQKSASLEHGRTDGWNGTALDFGSASDSSSCSGHCCMGSTPMNPRADCS